MQQAAGDDFKSATLLSVMTGALIAFFCLTFLPRIAQIFTDK